MLEVGLLVFVESISYADFTQKEFKDLMSKVLSVCNTAPQFKTKLLDKLVCNENASMAALVILSDIELLNWSTDNEMLYLHPASGDGAEYGSEIIGKENISYPVECFIWQLLGHKDKGIRCKASHALLRASKLGNLELVINISQFHHTQIPKSYMDEDNYFFLESVRIWYLATCLRIAKENPISLISIYPFFKFIACSGEVVHALQRRLAKEICLLLSPH